MSKRTARQATTITSGDLGARTRGPRSSSALPDDFRRFWVAAAVSNLGDGIRLAALPLLAIELTDDSRLIAGVTAASFLPWLLLGPVAGAVVDRHDRRILMLAGQICRCVAAIGLATSVSAGRANIAILYAAALVISAGETIVDSAAQSAIPHLVDDKGQLERANGQLTIAENLFNDVVGVALGAAIFARASSVPFYVDAATFALGAAFLSTIRRPLQGAPRASKSLRADVVEGMRYLLQHKFLRPLALSVATTNLALHMGLGVMVVLVVNGIGASKAAYGTILAVGAAGGVIGSLVAGRLSERFGAQRVLALTHAPFIAGAAITALATRAWIVSLAFAMSSFALVVYQIPSRTMRHRVTPDHLLGRVVGAFRVFGLGGPVLGAPIGGVIAHAAGVRWTFAASAAVMMLAWSLVWIALREYEPELETCCAT